MEPRSPSTNAYEIARRAHIVANDRRLKELGLPVARRVFDFPAAPCIKRTKPRRAVQQQAQRCSSRLASLSKPYYTEEALPVRGQRARLLLAIRGDGMSANPAQRSGKAEGQDWLAQSAAILGFTKVDNEWSHRKWPTEKVKAVVDFLETEW